MLPLEATCNDLADVRGPKTPHRASGIGRHPKHIHSSNGDTALHKGHFDREDQKFIAVCIDCYEENSAREPLEPQTTSETRSWMREALVLLESHGSLLC